VPEAGFYAIRVEEVPAMALPQAGLRIPEMFHVEHLPQMGSGGGEVCKFHVFGCEE
jgi:hypothetical protein